MTTETLSVPDISCDHCQRTIEAALGRLPGTPGSPPATPAAPTTVHPERP